MKVLFVTHYVELYGANRSLLTLLQGLVAHGYQLALLAPSQGPVTEGASRLGVQILTGDVKCWVVHSATLDRYNWRGRWYLIRQQLRSLFHVDQKVFNQVKVIQPDIVYTNSSVCVAGWSIAFRLKRPHVWHLREYAYEDYGLQFIVGRFLATWFIRSSATVVAVSRTLRDHYFRNLASSKVHVVYNGVLTRNQILDLEQAQISQTGPLRLLMMGVLHEKKGHELALRAIQKVNRHKDRVSLTVVGGRDGREQDRLRKAAERLGVAEHVMFIGYVDDPFPVYQKHDGLIMASEYEAMGRVTVEAMIAGLPVLGRNTGGTTELVRHCETGYLFANEDELARCIETVLEDRTRWQRMAVNASQAASVKFTAEEYVSRVEKILQKVAR